MRLVQQRGANVFANSVFMINFVGMMENSNITNVKSVYRCGAEYGAWFGIYLTAMSVAIMYGLDRSMLLLLVAFAMILGIPAIVYRMMLHYRKMMRGYAPFASLWMLGLMIFMFGSLICGAVTYILMQYVTPTYIYDQVVTAIELYKTVPGEEAAEMVRVMQAIVDRHALPTAMEVVVQMIMLVTFLGSLLSMALAGVMSFRRVPPLPPFRNKE